MSRSLAETLEGVRGLLLDPDALVRAVASGRRRGTAPPWRRAEVRYVDLRAGRRLQVVTFDETQSFTANHDPGAPAEAAVDALLDVPFGSWHVETATETRQVRVTKRGEAQVSSGPPVAPAGTATAPDRRHDRVKERLLPAGHPVLRAVGISDAQGRVKPTRQAKYRQVEELLRLLDQSLDAALADGRLRTPTDADPLRMVDLGCGNAYLTFAAHAHLAERGLPVRLTGVDTKAQSLRHGEELAARLGVDVRFVQGGIGDAVVDPVPEVVLALHACDTATDDALARAVAWGADLVLAAPCCHHDVAAQLRRADTPAPYSALTRDGILRERLADTLTDALRAALLRQQGYRVDVVEFVGSEHTPRNTLLRAVRVGGTPDPAAAADLDALTGTWGITPHLARLLR